MPRRLPRHGEGIVRSSMLFSGLVWFVTFWASASAGALAARVLLAVADDSCEVPAHGVSANIPLVHRDADFDSSLLTRCVPAVLDHVTQPASLRFVFRRLSRPAHRSSREMLVALLVHGSSTTPACKVPAVLPLPVACIPAFGTASASSVCLFCPSCALQRSARSPLGCAFVVESPGCRALRCAARRLHQLRVLWPLVELARVGQGA